MNIHYYEQKIKRAKNHVKNIDKELEEQRKMRYNDFGRRDIIKETKIKILDGLPNLRAKIRALKHERKSRRKKR